MTKAMRVDGSDISHHQSSVNLKVAERAGLKFLYHKATEGTSMRDSQYGRRRGEASAAGLPFGAYHFASPDGGDAVAEAKAFLAYAKPKPGDLVPCLDFEQMGRLKGMDAARTWAIAFSKEVKKQVGVLPVLYCPWNLGLQNLRWVPRYNDSNTPPTIPWDIWQFSNGVLGVPDTYPGLGHVDLNTFAKGTSLRDILIPKPEPEVERTGMFRVITQNVKALPLMPQGDVVEDIVLTASQAGIIGWQEIGPDRYKQAVKALNPKVWGHVWAGNARLRPYESPVSYRKSVFKVIAADAFKFQEGEAKISMDRYFTWVIFEHIATGLRFLFTNKHYVAGAWNDKDKPGKELRPGIWRAGKTMEVKFLTDMMTKYPSMPSINVGDYNATHRIMEREYPARVGGRPVNYQVGERAIDQIFLIASKDGKTTFKTNDEDGELLLGRNSDHQGRRSIQRIEQVV